MLRQTRWRQVRDRLETGWRQVRDRAQGWGVKGWQDEWRSELCHHALSWLPERMKKANEEQVKYKCSCDHHDHVQLSFLNLSLFFSRIFWKAKLNWSMRSYSKYDKSEFCHRVSQKLIQWVKSVSSHNHHHNHFILYILKMPRIKEFFFIFLTNYLS